MNRLELAFKHKHIEGKRSLGVFLNAGDPSLDITRNLLRTLEQIGVDFIELGVPFRNSFSDGKTIIRSHERALSKGIEFEDCLQFLEKTRTESDIPIVFLLDFSHSVKHRGIDDVVRQSAHCGADAILLHGVPPLFHAPFIEATEKYDIGRIFSLYPSSSDEKILETANNSRGFIYLVSQYGRTGSSIDFRSPTLQSFYERVRKATSLPLMAGFGIKSCDDMHAIFENSETDGVILGSALSEIIEQNLSSPEKLDDAVIQHLSPLIDMTCPQHLTNSLEKQREQPA